MEATTQNDQLGSRGSDFGSGEEEAGAESDVEDNADADEEEEETGMAEHNKVGCHPTFNSDIASPTGIHQTQQPGGEGSDSELQLQDQQKDNHQSRELIIRNELMTQMRKEFEENGREQSADYESQLEAKQRIIEELHQKLREATADNWRPAESPGLSNGHRELESLKNELVKLEQKLANANQEKDYYKKHFRGEEQNGGGDGDHGHNGRPRYEDDFGKELLLVNKRNYQLENRTRKLELELREAQQRMAHMGDNLKSAERLLWLEKERSATLEMEREQLNGEIGELRRNGDALRRELEMFRGEGGGASGMANNEQMEEEIGRVRRDCDLRVAEIRDMKNKLDWRLGEVSQQFHDTKWRLGEVEATLAHRDWELEQANNRIKQLESSLSANESALVREEAEKLREELARATEEKGQMQWRLGELTQWWNDAKWRVGELEAETTQRSHLLDRAHHRIGELERMLEGNAAFTERRNSELEQSRIGELEAELGAIRQERQELERIVGELKEQKSKVEWHLGEVTQWWNDAKWRIGEVEACQRWDGGAEKLAELESSNRRTKSLLHDGTLLIRKQPHRDRHKWKVLTMEHLLDSPPSRVWFETAAEGAKEVYLIGSFTNWECALLCESISEKPERRGLWLDLPAGRHEFRFLRDGQWHTEEKYADCWTEHGTKNNWIHVA